MIAVFDVWNFKDIQKVCSPVLAETEERMTLTYMVLAFTDDLCRAYGSNGYQVSRIEVPCKLSVKGLYTPEKVLLRPVKIPPKTKKVILSTDDPENVYITFYSADNYPLAMMAYCLQAACMQGLRPFQRLPRYIPANRGCSLRRCVQYE